MAKVPGFKELTVEPNEYLLDSHHKITRQCVISSAARDNGSASDHADYSTHLRRGLILGAITSGDESGKVAQFDAEASDGTETAIGILDVDVKVVDEDGDACDAVATYLVHGIVDEDKLFGMDDGETAKTDMAHVIFASVA